VNTTNYEASSYIILGIPVMCVLGVCIYLFLKHPEPVGPCIFITHFSNTLSLGPCILITSFSNAFHLRIPVFSSLFFKHPFLHSVHALAHTHTHTHTQLYIHPFIHSMDPCVTKTVGCGTNHKYTNVHTF